MKISTLMEVLGELQGRFGDIPVCIAQQQTARRVRLTGCDQVFFQYGIAYVTNMNDEQIADFNDQ